MTLGIDRVSQEFSDIICSDPELVELEFRAIMAGVRDEPMTAEMLRDHEAAASSAATEPRTLGARRPRPRGNRTRSSIRSPPLQGADSVGT